MNRLLTAAAVASVIAFTGNIQAHHSSAPHFDQSKTVEVSGSFTDLQFVNPHAYIYFDVEQNGETVNWRCELSSATQHTRNGWTPDMFEPGEKITVSGTPARREDNVCFMRNIVREDGSTLARNGKIGEGTEAVADAANIERPDYLENGQPNISGDWVSLSFGRNGQGIQPDWAASDAGLAAVGSYDMAFDDPILQCNYVNMIKGWNHDENVNEITQSDDTITLQYGFMDVVRTIHLDMDEHPDNITPSSTGHSIGKWDGNTLVVDTIGFEAGVWEHRQGSKHSGQMHVVERFHYDKDSKTLIRDYTINDPLYLTGSAVGQDIQAISSAPYQAYNCVELSGKNNIRPEEWEDEEPAIEAIPAASEQPEEKPWWKLWD